MSDHVYVQQLRSRKQEAMDAAKRLLDQADRENRDLHPREKREWDRLTATIDNANQQLQRWADNEATAAQADRLREDITRAIRTYPRGYDTTALLNLWAEAREGRAGGFDSTISPEMIETRALGTPGGSAIPTTFADLLIEYQRTTNPLLDPGVVTMIRRDSGAPLKVPRLTADPSTGGTVTAEAAAMAELDPTISAVTLTPFAYKVGMIYSSELAEDEIIDLEPLIARSAGRALAIDAGAHLTTGTGTVQPLGLSGVATNGGTAQGTAVSGGAAFFGWPDLVSLYSSVAAPYRPVGSFMVSSDAYAKILGLRDDNGAPVVLPALSQGVPPTLLGRPIYENPALASVGSATKSVYFGDFRSFVVTMVDPIRIETSTHYKWSTDQIALRVVMRVDGQLIDSQAVKYLVSANT